MEVTKLVAKAANEIEAAFKEAGVPGASTALQPYLTFAGLIRIKLEGRIPAIFLERFLCVPKPRSQT